MLTVAPGTTVEWVNDGGRHSVEADNGSFKSDVLKQGDKVSFRCESAALLAGVESNYDTTDVFV